MTSSLMFFLLFLKSEHSRLLWFGCSLLDQSKGTCVLAPVTAECLGVGICSNGTYQSHGLCTEHALTHCVCRVLGLGDSGLCT